MNYFPQEKIKCSVCTTEFLPHDDLDFVCKDCRSKLVCPYCQSDDVSMDWIVDDRDKSPYHWGIECVCGCELTSDPFALNEFDEKAKELFLQWNHIRLLTSGSTATAFGVDYAAPGAKDRSVKTLVENKNGGA